MFTQDLHTHSLIIGFFDDGGVIQKIEYHKSSIFNLQYRLARVGIYRDESVMMYNLTIDNHLCWGCKTCEVACKQENRAADGVKLIAVQENGPGLVDGKLDFAFQVNVCRHCEDPPCVEACPEDAIGKRPDGIVVMEYDLCTGCRACIEECPYDAIAFDEGKSIAQKCNLCHQRVDQGLIPACADNICPAHCIHFGSSEINSRQPDPRER